MAKKLMEEKWVTEKAVQLAESMGLSTAFSPLCCSQVFEDART